MICVTSNHTAACKLWLHPLCWLLTELHSGIPTIECGGKPDERSDQLLSLSWRLGLVFIHPPVRSLSPTLFVEIEVLQALVQVTGSSNSSDVGVRVDWSQAWDGRAVPHWSQVTRLWKHTHTNTYARTSIQAFRTKNTSWSSPLSMTQKGTNLQSYCI